MIQIYRIFSFVRPVLSKSVPTRQNPSYPPPSPNQEFLSLKHRKLPHISFKVATFQPQKQTFWRDRLLVFGLNQRLKHFRFLSSRRSIHLLPDSNFRIMITEQSGIVISFDNLDQNKSLTNRCISFRTRDIIW